MAAAPEDSTPGPATDLRRPALAGLVGVLLLFGVLGGWAGTTQIAGAVVASGQIEVSGKSKTVQTLDGGVVVEIAVADGDRVAAGDILVRLDPTLLRTNLDIARGRLAAALAERLRLEAEQSGAAEPVFDYTALPATLDVAQLDNGHHEAGQRAIFAARAEMLRGERDRLAGRLAEIDTQIAGSNAQIAALRDRLAYLDRDLENAETLLDRGLARQSQLSALQQSRAALVGELAGQEAELARLTGNRRDAGLETLQSERGFIEGVVTDLREVNGRIDELVLDIVTRTAQLDRVDIRAPIDGIVHELAMTTVGGVTAPGATLMDIVPLDKGLTFQARITPQSVDQVHEGQGAQVMISSLDPQTTPKLEGRVASISPEAITDERTGQAFYRAAIDVPESELARLPEGAVLIPGMPVETFLHTEERTVLSYLVHPLSAHLRRAFRE